MGKESVGKTFEGQPARLQSEGGREPLVAGVAIVWSRFVVAPHH